MPSSRKKLPEDYSGLSAQDLINKINDIISKTIFWYSSLEWNEEEKKIAEEDRSNMRALWKELSKLKKTVDFSRFRMDKAMIVDKEDFKKYLEKLGTDLNSLEIEII